MTKCPTCGSEVTIQSSDEGTQSFIPVHDGDGWIERKQRNPKIRGAYLVYKEGIDEISIKNFGTSSGWENGRNLGVDNIYRVTHWQPLPSPPTGGK